jgi:hypothetical protein
LTCGAGGGSRSSNRMCALRAHAAQESWVHRHRGAHVSRWRPAPPLNLQPGERRPPASAAVCSSRSAGADLRPRVCLRRWTRRARSGDRPVGTIELAQFAAQSTTFDGFAAYDLGTRISTALTARAIDRGVRRLARSSRCSASNRGRPHIPSRRSPGRGRDQRPVMAAPLQQRSPSLVGSKVDARRTAVSP